MEHLEEIQKEVCSRLDIDYDDIANNDFFTLAEITRWINLGMHWALAYKRQPFLQKEETDSIDATGKYTYPTKIRTKSIFLTTVDGDRYTKIAYEDYLKYLEDYPSGTDKVWAEFDRDAYINGNACSVGDAVIFYGQEVVIDLAGTSTIVQTPFYNAEPNGDEAIARWATAKGLRKQKRSAEAIIEEREAKVVLEMIWDRIQEAMPREVRKETPLFRRIDILRGGTINRNNRGNF